MPSWRLKGSSGKIDNTPTDPEDASGELESSGELQEISLEL